MSNENDHADGDPDESVNDDKHRWDAKDLQKVLFTLF
jgi:hypothetical protein